MKIITAKFIGKDGSLGYKNGSNYQIQILPHSNAIMRSDGSGKCVYSSIYSFFKNWELIF